VKVPVGLACGAKSDRALDQRDETVAIGGLAHQQRQRRERPRGRMLHDDFLGAFDAPQVGELDRRQQLEVFDREAVTRLDARERNRLAPGVQQRGKATDRLGIAAFGHALEDLAHERCVAGIPVAPAPAQRPRLGPGR